MKSRVLIVDDEEAIRSSLKMIFEYEGYEVILAANGQAALKIAEKDAPDLIFLDIKMPQMDGLEVLKRLRADENAPPVVILSGHGNVKTAVEATKLGAFDFIEKPPESDRILLVARNALGQKGLETKLRLLKLSFDERYKMVGQSASLEKVWDAVRRAAPTNATVSATRRARSRGQQKSRSASSSWPTRGRSSWTRSATCPSAPRPRSCACCKRGRWSGSAPRRRSRWTCG